MSCLWERWWNLISYPIMRDASKKERQQGRWSWRKKSCGWEIRVWDGFPREADAKMEGWSMTGGGRIKRIRRGIESENWGEMRRGWKEGGIANAELREGKAETEKEEMKWANKNKKVKRLFSLCSDDKRGRLTMCVCVCAHVCICT